ncbi:MAG: FAD-binding oxidoreductase [Anaerolineae bacterium]|jgi:FAD-dependent oxidoreductase domain-containing protein 1|nr:FAD-binding oxidoreductase [Anaerolineae bacterium]MBT7069622.1 FAD-binding oxidoreductase [Anaerolineae bacterium]MBT7324346.1 FAD-binding oxidoreductase [Anaerolineae bacterium]
MTKKYDAIMVGGGVMGCATAYYLMKKAPQLKVAIIEKDPTYEFNSSVLSDANIRLQFNIKENIQISQYGIEKLKTFADDMAVDGVKPDVAFRHQGNLFMADEAGKASTQKGIATQQSLGCPTEWLEPAQVKEKFSLFEVDQIAGAGWSPVDGTMDANAVLIGYKNKAIALGAEFIKGEVREILKDDGRVTGVRLASGDKMQADFVVNSSGAWTKGLTKTIGVELPVVPIKRHVFVVDTNVEPDVEYPLTVFPSGLYLIQEHANTFLVGKSLDSDPVGIDFAFDRNIFIEELWEELVGFAPVFDQLKITGGWAGLYAVNTFDGNAILGEWPCLKGFMLANGFSGHGFQQCHGVGRYLAELILGETPTIDLSIFSPQRILDNKPVFESEHKLV